MSPFSNDASWIILAGSGWTGQGTVLTLDGIRDPIQAWQVDDVLPALREVERRTNQGEHAIGFLTYEAATAFGLPVNSNSPSPLPLCWFGMFHETDLHEEQQWPHWINTGSGVVIQEKGRPDFAEYARRLSELQRFIGAGESYQVNYTLRLEFELTGEDGPCFEQWWKRQPVPYGMLIHTPDWSVHSLSPELFLQRRGNQIMTRPMKGTLPRGRFLAEDQTQREQLHHSPKNRAENLMIVDMMRNDLGRFCPFGSIQTGPLFTVEPYRTVLQMTSTVTGALPPDTDLHRIFAATFPAASITGAPKRRTMEIIRDAESSPRGVYCGAMGWIRAGGDFTFNVAIRTITRTRNHAVLGVGGGILWESDASNEYEEIFTKAAFLFSPAPRFQLIETLRLDECKNYLWLEDHLERLEQSARYWMFTWSLPAIRERLEAYKQQANAPCAVRLLLSEDGDIHISHRPLLAVPSDVHVIISPQRTDSHDSCYFHKTTNRSLYDEEREKAKANGFFEVIFQNEIGLITEGCVTNLFIFKNQSWITPPVTDGLLPGIWRKHFLAETHAREASLTIADLLESEVVVIGNSVLGAVRVHHLETADGKIQRFSPIHFEVVHPA